MTTRLLAVSLLTVLSAFPAAAQLALGDINGTINYSGSALPQTVEGWVAYLDLSSGAFTPVVTSKSTECEQHPNTVEVADTKTFAANKHAFVAITANTGPFVPDHPSCLAPVGLLMSNGQLVHPQEDCGLELYFTDKTHAAITDGPLPDIGNDITWAVSGTTKTDNDCLPMNDPLNPQPLGGLLVHHGQVGPCVAPKSTSITFRSAAGLDVTGTILILVAITGMNGSPGLRLPDFSSLLIGLGAYQAVNFDGGGSTAFVWNPVDVPESEALVNMMTHAHFPAGVPNGNAFKFSVSHRNPATSHISYCVQEPDKCRLVFAGLGFTLAPTAKKK